MPRYGPPDAADAPRFSGPRTFMRLPHVRDLDGVDVAVVGVPTDDAVVFRSGARFGPEAIRSASVMLRNYNPMLGVDLAEKLLGRRAGLLQRLDPIESCDHAARFVHADEGTAVIRRPTCRFVSCLRPVSSGSCASRPWPRARSR